VPALKVQYPGAALKFFDGFLDDATVQKVYDNLAFIHGVDAFLNAHAGALSYFTEKKLGSFLIPTIEAG
jgi:hypothetical protein